MADCKSCAMVEVKSKVEFREKAAWLIDFLVTKNKILDFELTTHEDMAEILIWSSSQVEKAYGNIIKYLEEGGYSPRTLCPWCYVFGLRCGECTYGSRHQICEKVGSTYQNLQKHLQIYSFDEWEDIFDVNKDIFKHLLPKKEPITLEWLAKHGATLKDLTVVKKVLKDLFGVSVGDKLFIKRDKNASLPEDAQHWEADGERYGLYTLADIRNDEDNGLVHLYIDNRLSSGQGFPGRCSSSGIFYFFLNQDFIKVVEK